MKKSVLWFLIFFFTISVSVSGHTPLLMIMDNEDGTLTAEGGYSTGASAKGIDFYVKTKMEGKMLLHKKFPESGTITIKIPNEPYVVIFNGGPGHKVVKDGPAPPKGFTINRDAKKLISEKSDLSGITIPIPVIILIVVIAVLLVFLVPGFSMANKNGEEDG